MLQNTGSAPKRRRRSWGKQYRLIRFMAVAAGCAALANCSSSTSKLDPRYGVSASPRVVADGQPVPKGGGTYRVGKPYVVAGKTYIPEDNPNYRAEGVASWYGDDFHGRLTANGEVYDTHGISAAHKTLPMPCYVRVTNLANNRSLIVRVNDRGPYHGNREIDVSGKAAELLGFRDHGLANVRVEYVGRAPLEGSDDRQLIATLREGAPAPAPGGLPVLVASAEPFVPTYEARTRLPAGDAPVPAERPFDLGAGGGSVAANGAARAVVATLPQTPALDNAPRQALVPVTAYAPVSYDGARSVSTGRGLY